VAPVTLTARVVRAARSAVLVETVITALDRTCLQARTWLIPDTDTAAVAHRTPPRPVGADLPRLGPSFPYWDSIEWRAELGAIHEIGPGRVWARPSLSIVADEPLAGLQRVALVGDSASGISSELDWARWSFVNVDLDVHLARPVLGEWILLDARTQLGGHGSALTRATVYDIAGELGATAQTLVLAALPTDRVDKP
jgi:hypothetical protein